MSDKKTMNERKIDQLKAILESQERVRKPFKAWEELTPVYEETESGLNLVVDKLEVGFAFDKTGQKFLGIFNWKS